MIETIIDLINNQLDGIDKDEIILGIAEQVYRSKSDGTVEYMPGVLKLGTDEVIYAGVDDVNSIMMYHRLNTAALAFAPAQNGSSGYGDVRRHIDNISVIHITIWDTRKIKIYAPDMLLLIRARMPQVIIDVPGINSLEIIVNNAQLNTRQIFQSEYSFDEKYILPHYFKMMQLNYTIALRYDPACVDKCINC
jgi:hypothetical protein